MEKQLRICIVLLTLLCACKPAQLAVVNQSETGLTVVIQSLANDVPAEPAFFTQKDTVLNLPVMTGNDGDLIRIQYQKELNSSPVHLRYSRSYLESHQWKIEIPPAGNDTLRYHPMEFKEISESIFDHSFYFRVQDLYNAGKYTDCIRMTESIPLSLLQLLRSNSTFGIEYRGMLTLSYLSSVKMHNDQNASRYWDILWKSSDLYAKFLKEHDVEVSAFHAK